MSDTVSAALSIRDSKLQAHTKARSEAATELRGQIIKLKLDLLKATPGSAEAKAGQSALDSLLAKRASLMADPELEKAQAALSASRREVQAAAVAGAAAKMREMPTEELAKRRDNLVAQRRALKAELRVVQYELASREAAQRVEKLLEALSGDEKAKLLKALSESK